ncbi:alpha/beta hydrolase [Acinetobacter sp. NCu2D-2]|uniref:alpha/beta hydrolase family protein n=1 Tax=Acinetobacter sp. NCu2D-2 TaxID=1608473 RepID=UPI0007CDE093|nr:alpha/beta fold hydrolase [Acinetobacter sp. NCu2D-2]ANF81888.1 alpha/beta hydrolase [Acinetobacter sp. NCu2D-2]
MSESKTLTITCVDGYPLSAVFYPSALADSKPFPVLICPATGIVKGFYHHFATWLQQQGYDTMVFDFRGIGGSLHEPLRQSKASIVQWGQRDIPAAIDALLAQTSAEKVIIVGHSAGGQLLGIVPNYDKVAKVVAVSGSTGHVKNIRGRTGFLAPIMFNVIFPIGRYTVGYGPTNKIGMGENLPKDVAREWAQFCSKPGYVINAIGKQIDPSQDFHSKIKCPITAIWATDDDIASEANVKDLIRLYPNAATDIIPLEPKKHGHKVIGHMLMFKRSHQNLWPIIEQQIAA